MLRLSELRLPLAALPLEPEQHPEAALRALAAQALGIAPQAIATLHVHKRSFDARKAELLAVYIVDVALAAGVPQQDVLARHAGHPHIQPTPDMAWRPVGQAPGTGAERPVVVGFGPAASLPRWCWRRWAFGPSCWSAARRCASARRTPGACGASAC
jgi:uncharacterized FAD-dependent dehydrogenase